LRGGKTFLPENVCMKNYINCTILPENIFLPNWEGGGTALPAPASYTYGLGLAVVSFVDRMNEVTVRLAGG